MPYLVPLTHSLSQLPLPYLGLWRHRAHCGSRKTARSTRAPHPTRMRNPRCRALQRAPCLPPSLHLSPLTAWGTPTPRAVLLMRRFSNDKAPAILYSTPTHVHTHSSSPPVPSFPRAAPVSSLSPSAAVDELFTVSVAWPSSVTRRSSGPQQKLRRYNTAAIFFRSRVGERSRDGIRHIPRESPHSN